MHKWLGSILIIVACSAIGICKGQEMQWHLKDLEQIKQLFYMLRSELQYTKAPLTEVFEKLGKKVGGRYGEWFLLLCERLKERGNGSFWEIWCYSLDRDLNGSYLEVKEIEELKNVGKNLSYFESLDLYIDQLEHDIQNTRESYQSKRKLCQSMGIMGGIFLVILLL